MTTKREAFLQQLVAQIQQAGIGAHVERTVDNAFAREDGNIIIVHRGAEFPAANVSSSAMRDCDFQISTLTRGNSPEAASDALLEVIHPLVMNFKADGLMQMKELGTEQPKYGDGKTCLITVRYQFRYRTAAASLSA